MATRGSGAKRKAAARAHVQVVPLPDAGVAADGASMAAYNSSCSIRLRSGGGGGGLASGKSNNNNNNKEEEEEEEGAVRSVALAKHVREYALPGARQTHEMVALRGLATLLVSQQTNSTLLRIALDAATGRPVSVHRFLVGSFWAGLHGLALSHTHPDHVWATLQFTNLLLRLHVQPSSISVVQVIALPASVNGPHCIIESGPFLWVTCKDSSHVVRVDHTLDADGDDDDDDPRFAIFPTSRRPIFVAVHGLSGDVYASLDLDSKLWRLELRSGLASEIELTHGSIPVGLATGPDGNVWFSMLGGGTGSFARISRSGELHWFRLATPLGKQAGLIHLAFDFDAVAGGGIVRRDAISVDVEHDDDTGINGKKLAGPVTIWLLGSTLLTGAGKGVDGIFSVVIDRDRIVAEHGISFPTQGCGSHRVLRVGGGGGGVFATQLLTSTLAHVHGSAVLTPLETHGEVTDYYACFGEGQPSSQYNFVEDDACAAPKHLLDNALMANANVSAISAAQERPKKRPYPLAAPSA